MQLVYFSSFFLRRLTLMILTLLHAYLNSETRLGHLEAEFEIRFSRGTENLSVNNIVFHRFEAR